MRLLNSGASSLRPLALTALVLALSLSGCTKTEKAQVEPTTETVAKKKAAGSLAGTRVEVAVLEPSLHSLTLRLPGEIQSERDALLSSALGGYVEQVDVKEGDRVKRGAVLARVDSQTHTTRLLRAKVELNAAEREQARDKSLQGTIPQAEIDSAGDRVESAKASLRELQLNVERSLIKAPFSGIVVRSDAEQGEVAGPGSPLFRLVSLKPIHVSVTLSDRDIALAKEGMTARVQLDARSGIYEGKVIRLSRAADLKTRAFEAVVELPNEDESLLPGMIAQVTLSTDQSDPKAEDGKPASESSDTDAKDSSVIMISQDWLVTDPKGVGVFVAESSNGAPVARWRPVTLGPVVHRQVTVESGLSEGDALIIVGHRTLADGDAIIIHRQGICCRDGRPLFGDGAP